MIPVLYVDDESSLLDVGKQFLEMTGEFSVTTALSASDALDRMKSTQIQAIVSDYQMPGINGIEFLKLVRSTDKLIPFIIFTGKGREEIAIEAFENGADFYLQKGGDPKAQFAELSLKIRTAVEKRTTEQALREQREEMKMFFVVSLDFYAIMTTAGLFVQLNPEWERLLGYPLQELIGKSALEFVHPDDLLSTTAAMEELAKNRPVLNLVNRYRCRDGTYRWLEWRIYPSEGTLFYASARDITERKHDEDALRHSEENYRSLFTTMLNGFAHHEIICDAAGIPVDYRFIDVNPAFERLTGLKREDILGKTALEVLPGLEPVWIERYGKTALTGEQQLFENFSSELGKHFEVNVYSPKTGEFTTIFSDVTERKRAEEALIQNEEKFRTIFDTAANLIITVNRQGFIVDCNERVKDLLGYEKSEIIGQSVAKIIHPDQIVKAQGCLTKILSTGSSYNNIYKMVKKDGAFVDVSINSTGLKDKDGAYFRSVCIIADITEKKHVVDELRESEQRFRTLSENLPDYVLVHRNGEILYANLACERGLGVLRENVVHHPVLPFIAPEYHEKILSAMHRRMQGEVIEPYEIDILTTDGSRRSVILNGALIDFEGSPASLNVLTDITDLKKTQDSLILANKKLNLLSSITRHDVINQLTALRGALEIAGETITDEKTAGFLAIAQKTATAIDRQIVFTREYQDLGVAVPSWQNVNDSITRATAHLPMRGIPVIMDRADLEVYADPLFEKVFYNLIENALRHGGSGMTAISVSVHTAEGNLVISCEDNGRGVLAADKNHIFEKGFGENTGLGLFLTREILSITGIAIAENGTPGKGARFEIAVPKGAYRFTDETKP